FSGNTANDGIVHTIEGTDPSTVIGLAGGFTNGVDKIVGNGAKVVGTGVGDALDFSQVEITGVSEIDSGNNNDTITTSNLSAASYRGGHGNDTFNLGTQNTTQLYARNDNGPNSFSGNTANDGIVHT